MKKFIFNLLTILMATVVSVSFVSCSSDDDDSASIVGTWRDGNSTMELGSGGSYYSYYGSDRTGSESQYRKGTYSYNASQGLMTINIVAVPNHNNAYQETFIVQTLTSSTLVLIYTDGSVEGYYTRVK